MKYEQIVESINQDMKQLESIERPIVLYEEGKSELAEIQKKRDAVLTEVKNIWYPLWILLAIINSSFIIGYYYQEKLMKKGQRRIEIQD